MREIAVCRLDPTSSKVINRALKVSCIPQDDAGNQQIQTACSIALVFVGALADFTEPVEEHGAAECILLFTFIEPDVTATTQLDIFRSLMAALAEFERDLLRERVRSGIAAARRRGVVFGRQRGQRVKADRFATRVLKLVAEGQSYREISHRLGLSKTRFSISLNVIAPLDRPISAVLSVL